MSEVDREIAALRVEVSALLTDIAAEAGRVAKGAAPCVPDPEDIEHDRKSYRPRKKWQGVHDWDGGECWRCGGTEPGWSRRREYVSVSVEATVKLLGMGAEAEFLHVTIDELPPLGGM